MSKLIKFWVVLLAAAIVLIVIIAAGGVPALASDGCPHPGGASGGTWFLGGNSDQPDYTDAINAGATSFCYKASGNTLTSPTPLGGSFNDDTPPEWIIDGMTQGLSHWVYFVPNDTPTPVTPTNTPETPTATPETPTATPETPTATPTDDPEVTPSPTPTDDPEVTPTPTPTPTDTPEEPTPTPTSTQPPRDPTPTATKLPSTGPDDENPWSNEPWLCWGDNVWCAHNGVDGSPAQDWVFYYEGSTFEFMGETYTVELVEQVDPSNTEVLGKAGDYDVVLLTCRNWTPSGVWLDRFIVFANALDG